MKDTGEKSDCRAASSDGGVRPTLACREDSTEREPCVSTEVDRDGEALCVFTSTVAGVSYARMVSDVEGSTSVILAASDDVDAVGTSSTLDRLLFASSPSAVGVPVGGGNKEGTSSDMSGRSPGVSAQALSAASQRY